MKKALIIGISGQDGSYLSEYLLSLKYKIFGIVRRKSICEEQATRIDHINNNIKTFYGDLLDYTSLQKIIHDIEPDEIYNLGAQSHVRVSFDIPIYTCQVNAIGLLNLLEICKNFNKNIKIFQASSSEMFGNNINKNNFQDLNTKMEPVSPYGASKLFAHNLCKIYRNAYNMFICCGISFNHESPRRGTNFVTNKIVKNAVQIKLGLKKNIELGNLDSFRDWSHSKDVVKAYHLILNYKEPDDWIISSGKYHSVRDLCEYVFLKLGLDDYKKYIIINDIYLRPNEINYLKGDNTKIKKKLNWEPKYSYESMLDEMIEHWIKYFKK